MGNGNFVNSVTGGSVPSRGALTFGRGSVENGGMSRPRHTSLRIRAVLLAGGVLLAWTSSAGAVLVQAEGLDSGLLASSPAVAIADAPPLGDDLEFQLFYAPDAGNGETVDYDGQAPLLESSLVPDAAHLLFLRRGGDLALFVVYKRDAGTQSADATLSASGGDFTLADLLVRDAAADSYAIASGDLVTSHRITLGGRTDGYVAALGGRFGAPGDTLQFDFATPAAGTSDLPFTSIRVYGGLDGGGSPIWTEVDAGPFSSSTARRVRLTLVSGVPTADGISPLVLIAALLLASGILLGRRPRATPPTA